LSAPFLKSRVKDTVADRFVACTRAPTILSPAVRQSKSNAEHIDLPIPSFCLGSDFAAKHAQWGGNEKKILLASVASAALVAIAPANAADLGALPVYTAPTRVPVFTWTG